LREHLQLRKLGTLIHYPVPVHLQPAYKDRIPVLNGSLPVTESASREILSLPMHPHLTDAQVEMVCTEITDWFEKE
jgi:dTDP-4-amino-4,6-dideoxygalactose transaminase